MKNRKIALAMMALLIMSTSAGMAQDAAAILEQLDKVLFAPADQVSQVQMILTDRSGHERVREADIWQKGDDMRLVRFTSPAAEAGIAFLSLPDDVMYVYMPAFGRERRIASHVKNQSFAGTDFTYEDMEAMAYSDKYKPTLLETTDQHYIMELIPLPDIRSDYSKLIGVIDKQNHYPVSSTYFDRGGKKIKTAEYHYVKKGKYWYPEEIHMTDLQRNHSTRMRFLQVEFDTGISDNTFTVRNLTRP
jgi:outer membrane lipoprotein-sorting protein